MRVSGHHLRQVSLHLPECELCTEEALVPQGHGLCECGQVSPHVVTFKARKRWHSDHLLAVHERSSEGGRARDPADDELPGVAADPE